MHRSAASHVIFWLGPCRSTGLESSSIERGVCLKQRMVLMVCVIEKQGQFFLFVLRQPCMSFGVQDKSTCKYCCCLFLVQFSVISSADAVRKSLIFAWIVVHRFVYCVIVRICYCALLWPIAQVVLMDKEQMLLPVRVWSHPSHRTHKSMSDFCPSICSYSTTTELFTL